jgi:hypothetical protein
LDRLIQNEMMSAGTNHTKRKVNPLGSLLALSAALLCLAAPEAKANTYLFSFTGRQALDALEASQGTAEHMQSAYFVLFVKPNPLDISGYSYASFNTPTPNAADPWTVSTITDPSAPELGYDSEFQCEQDCTWVKWGKNYLDDQVAVLTDANFFLGAQWGDSAPSPYGWGSGPGPAFDGSTITSLLSPTSVFTFAINTNQVLNGSYTFQGIASALVSGSPTAFSGIIKDTVGISFTLELEAESPVPEPGTWALCSISLLALGGRSLWRRRRPARPNAS